MKFFIDTCNIDQIKEAHSIGVLDGVTTNPSLAAKENAPYDDMLKEICAVVKGPVSAEVVSLDADGMLKEGKVLAKIADNINIKVPIMKEGLKAVKRFTAEGIPTNTTLIFQPMQALLAARAGSTFVSPFIGRIDDMTMYGMDVIRDIVTIYDIYDLDTEVIAASIRNPLHVVDAALAGAHISTIPFKVIEQIIKHPLTDIGIEKFLADWEKVKDR